MLSGLVGASPRSSGDTCPTESVGVPSSAGPCFHRLRGAILRLLQLGSIWLLYVAVIVAHIADRAIFGVQVIVLRRVLPNVGSVLRDRRSARADLRLGGRPAAAHRHGDGRGERRKPWAVASLVAGLAGVSAFSTWKAPGDSMPESMDMTPTLPTCLHLHLDTAAIPAGTRP